MLEKTDAQLLREYVEHRNEAAFGEIVSRHADVVYASALRQVNSPDLAHDIAQGVFSDLARKARPLAETLTRDASLLGWLFRSTRFLALNQLRDDRRRQTRERQAMENFDPISETAPEWERIQPVLDEAMADLTDEDRDAVLLRFFKNRDFRTIGAALGVSDDAAQKRVSRALERLRTQLTSRGVTTTTVALSTVLSANAVPMAPAGLAAMLSTAALAGTTFATTATTTAVKTIAMTTIHKTLIAATLAAAVGAGIYEARQVSNLRDQVQSHGQQGETLELQAAEIERLSLVVAQAKTSQALADERLVELLRRRGEAVSLRNQTNELARLKQEYPQFRSSRVIDQNYQTAAPRPEAIVPKEAWTFAGYATPEAALQSLMWAKSKGDVKAYWASLSPDEQQSSAQKFEGKPESEIATSLIVDASGTEALRLDRRIVLADGGVGFVLSATEVDNGATSTRAEKVIVFRNLGGEWKATGLPVK